MMANSLKRLGLEFIPFEPAASGAPVGIDLWLPSSWSSQLTQLLTPLTQGKGVKALAVAGEYGSGKSYILQWLHRQWFPEQRIKPFYFDNPDVHFYALANNLLRQVGRKDFAKCLWELAAPYVGDYQQSLFARGYEAYLAAQKSGRRSLNLSADLQSALIKAGVTSDEEIAIRLAQIVLETPKKPYFEYRDFIAGRRDSYVAEKEEVRYFGAILKTLRLAAGINAVAFLIDEFEEISFQKSLSQREAHDYLITLKHLIDLTEGEDLWLVVGMTPDAVEKTRSLVPQLWSRFTSQGRYLFTVQPPSEKDAIELVKHRLESARIKDFKAPNELFPFPDDFATALRRTTISSPRWLVQLCFRAISDFKGKPLPFSHAYLQDIENKMQPLPEGGE